MMFVSFLYALEMQSDDEPWPMLQFFENIMFMLLCIDFCGHSKLCYEPCFQWSSLVCLNYLCVPASVLRPNMLLVLDLLLICVSIVSLLIDCFVHLP